MLNIKRLKFSDLEKMLLNAVLNRLNSAVHGQEFHIRPSGGMVQVVAVKSETIWYFPSKDYLLGHCNALHSFTNDALFTLK